MIGVGLLFLVLLIGIRFSWILFRYRGIGVFVAMVAGVTYAALGRAEAPATTEPPSEAEQLVLKCQRADTGVEGCTAAIQSGYWQGDALAWAYTNRGLAHAATGQMLSAIADHSEAIKLRPDDPAGWTNRGNAHAVLGDLFAALKDHEMALDLAPTSASAWHNKAVDLEELGRHREALEGYRKALALDPGHRGSHLGLATASCKLSRVNASVKARLSMLERGLLDARAFQQQLKQDGFYGGPLDGLFGKGSRAALRAWTRKGCLAQS
ncbi:MAG: tetratricopeptide repeat protein [Pseudomonadota bacterium]